MGIDIDRQATGAAVPQQLGFDHGSQIGVLDFLYKAALGAFALVIGVFARCIRADFQFVLHFTNTVNTQRQFLGKMTLDIAIHRTAQCCYAVVNFDVNLEGVQVTIERVGRRQRCLGPYV